MSFLSAAFLWGLPLVAVPVAIHLLHRRRPEVIRWGAMQFLIDSSIRQRKIRRLDELVLMLVRTAAVLALVLALARPLWQRAGWRGTGRDVIVIWDVSLSMDRRVDGEPVFVNILRRTEELFATLDSYDTIRGMVTIGKGEWIGRNAVPANPANRARLFDSLKNVGVTRASADWIAALGAALRAESPSGALSKYVVVLSDRQAAGWKADDRAAWANLVNLADNATVPTAIELCYVTAAATVVRNLSLDGLSVPRTIVGPAERLRITAEIRNRGQTPVAQQTLIWTADGQSLGTTVAGPWEPGQSSRTAIEFAPEHPGTTLVSCRLDCDDELPLDNSASVVVELVDRVPILVVDDAAAGDPLQSDHGYLLAALGQLDALSPRTSEKGRSVFRADLISSRELATHPLRDYRAIMLLNPPPLETDSQKRLMDFTRQGGGCWWCLGDRTEPDAFNARMTRPQGGPSPWELLDAVGDPSRHDQSVSIHPPEGDHPATALMGDTQRLDLDRARIFRRFRFRPSADRQDVAVLLATGNGDPLAIETALGRGRIIIQTIPLGVGWSNLPLMQVYVPWVQEWLWYLVQPTAAVRNLQPGEPLRALIPDNEHVTAVELTNPANETVALVPRVQGEQRFCQTRRTLLPGEYRVTIAREGADPLSSAYHVARNPAESDLEPLGDELSTLLARKDLVRIDPARPLAPLSTGSARERGAPLSGWLLAIVLACGPLELWMALKMARRRFMPTATVEPNGTSARMPSG